MKQLILWSIVVLGFVALMMFGLAQVREAAAQYEYAQAARVRAYGEAQALIINAQTESRLHAAQAAIITQAANLPYVVLGMVVVFGSIALYLVVASPRRVEHIEARIIFVLEPGDSRKEMWQRIGRATASARRDNSIAMIVGKAEGGEK